MTELERPSERAVDLTVAAVAYALHYLKTGEEFAACVIAESATEEMMPLPVPELDQEGRGVLPVLSMGDLEPLHEHLGEHGDSLDAYAIVFDGTLTGESGERRDAVLVEVGERGRDIAHVFAQPYTPKRLLRPLERSGQLILLEQQQPNRLRK